MTRQSAFRRLALTLGALTAIGGCGGRFGGSGGGNTEYAYIATGTNIVQCTVSATGQLTELIPNTAASVNAVSVATTADNRFAYAANSSNGTISQYRIGGSGLLTAMNPATVNAAAGTNWITVTPDSKFLYALNGSAGNISEFSIGGDGKLTPLATPTITTNGAGVSLCISPNGHFVYASVGQTTLDAFSVGLDGELTPLAVPTYAVGSAAGQAVSPNGEFLYVPLDGNSVLQYSIAGDGSLTPLNPASVTTVGDGNDTIAFTPTGTFAYLGEFNGGFPASPVEQFSIGGDGTLTALNPSTVAAGNAPQNVVVDPAGKYVYVCNANDGTVNEYSINVDGTLAALTPASINPNGARQIAFAKK